MYELLERRSSPFHCRVPGCKVLHHTTLHDDDNNDNKKAMKKETPVTKIGFTKASKRQVLLQVLPVKIRSMDGKELTTYAILDDCSQATLVREDFAEKLGMKGTKVDVSIGTITQDGEDLTVSQVSFKVTSTTFHGDTFVANGAYSIPKSKFHVLFQKTLSVS